MTKLATALAQMVCFLHFRKCLPIIVLCCCGTTVFRGQSWSNNQPIPGISGPESRSGAELGVLGNKMYQYCPVKRLGADCK